MHYCLLLVPSLSSPAALLKKNRLLTLSKMLLMTQLTQLKMQLMPLPTLLMTQPTQSLSNLITRKQKLI